MSIFLSKPNDSTCTMGPIPSHLLKHFSFLCLMPVFQVLFTEKLFKGSVKAHFHLFPSLLKSLLESGFRSHCSIGRALTRAPVTPHCKPTVSPQFSSQLCSFHSPLLKHFLHLVSQAIALCGSLPASPSIHFLCPRRWPTVKTPLSQSSVLGCFSLYLISLLG